MVNLIHLLTIQEGKEKFTHFSKSNQRTKHQNLFWNFFMTEPRTIQHPLHINSTVPLKKIAVRTEETFLQNWLLKFLSILANTK